MDIVVSPKKLSGKVKAISSKSVAHRMLICASLADKKSEIEIDSTSADIEATISALTALGAQIKKENNIYTVYPIKDKNDAFVDCNESGSTLRFLVPVASSLGKKCVFDGRGRLPSRPMKALTDEMTRHSVCVSDSFPIHTEGQMTGGKFTVDGSVSSQFITGLLMSLPQIGGGEIEVTGNFQSRSYVDITLSVMEKFGVNVEEKGNSYIIPDKKFISALSRAEGDWSNSAFFLSVGVEVENLDTKSKQGDKKIIEVLKALEKENEEIFIDVSDIPDLVPVISVKASVRKGKTNIINAERLKLKESDRILSCVEMINNLGGKAEGTDNSIIIEGVEKLKGGKVDAYNDHRIVMSAAIASCFAEGDITICGAEAVNKSYPAFFEDMEKLGGKYNVL